MSETNYNMPEGNQFMLNYNTLKFRIIRGSRVFLAHDLEATNNIIKAG